MSMGWMLIRINAWGGKPMKRIKLIIYATEIKMTWYVVMSESTFLHLVCFKHNVLSVLDEHLPTFLHLVLIQIVIEMTWLVSHAMNLHTIAYNIICSLQQFLWIKMEFCNYLHTYCRCDCISICCEPPFIPLLDQSVDSSHLNTFLGWQLMSCHSAPLTLLFFDHIVNTLHRGVQNSLLFFWEGN